MGSLSVTKGKVVLVPFPWNFRRLNPRPHDQGAGNAASGTALSSSDRREPEAPQCSTTRAAELVLGLTSSAARETAAAGAWLRSPEVVAIKVHHLVPRGHEVAHERLLPVVTPVDLRDGPEFGV